MSNDNLIPEWLDLGPVTQIPLRGARSVPVAGGEEIAIFRTGEDRIYALENRCPHKGGPLSQGIVIGDRVACPLHNWTISLKTGEEKNAFLAWTTSKGSPYTPTPIIYGAEFYVLADNGVLSAYDAKSGETIYQQRLPSSFSASPFARLFPTPAR
jgi:nitrite reductase (NADH) small subunit